MKAIIWCRCSTDESRQDVELQIKPCKEYCEKNNWEYDIISDYVSGFKGVSPKLQFILNEIAKGTYQVIVVYSLDRFSRLKPNLTEKMLNHITDCKCRFISLQENLDSDNPMIWYCFKGLWLYFANQYSINLSKKIKAGMEKAKEKGVAVGRPKGSKDKKIRNKKGYYKRVYKFKVDSSKNIQPNKEVVF